MRPSKTEIQLPTSTVAMSFHESNPLRTDGYVKPECSASISPTFPRATCTKHHRSIDDQHHIFGLSLSADSTSSTNQLPMNLTMPSFGVKSSQYDKLNSSFNSVGLPSDYPLHRKSASSTTVAVEEELEDFEFFCGEHVSQRSSLETSFSSLPEDGTFDIRSLPPESPQPPYQTGVSKKEAKQSGHRRRRSQGLDFGSLHSVSSTSSETVESFRPQRGRHNRGRNQAMGAKDFHESVLSELFEDVSVTEFQY